MESPPRAPSTGKPDPQRHPGYGTGAFVWLFRHGEVHEEWQGRAYGGLDVPLSVQGELDTRETARRFGSLPLRCILSSSLRRARVLGEALARESGAPLQITPALAEIQRGRWQGLTVSTLHAEHAEEVAAFYADPWAWNGHGGETDQDVAARAWPSLERLLAEHGAPHPGGDPAMLALTCHYNVIRVLVARMLGIAPEHSFRLRVDLSGAVLLRDTPAGWTLVRANVREPWPASDA